MQGQFNKQKSINAVYHISKRIKTHMTVSTDMEKALNNSQHSLMIKTPRKLGIKSIYIYPRGFPGVSVVNNLPADAGDTGSILGLGRSHMPWSN